MNRVRNGRRAPWDGWKTRVVLLLSAATALTLIALFLLLPAARRPVAAAVEPALDFGRFASPGFPLNRGLTLVVFLSMDCSHCIQAAQQIGTFDAAAHGLRVYLVLLGKAEEVEPFFQTIGAWLPYCLAPPQDYADFAATDDPPTIYLLSDGRRRAQWLGSRFNLNVLSEELQRLQQ